jgi:hypothetical protein
MPQPVHGFVRRKLAAAYLLKKFANGFRVHVGARLNVGAGVLARASPA